MKHPLSLSGGSAIGVGSDDKDARKPSPTAANTPPRPTAAFVGRVGWLKVLPPLMLVVLVLFMRWRPSFRFLILLALMCIECTMK